MAKPGRRKLWKKELVAMIPLPLSTMYTIVDVSRHIKNKKQHRQKNTPVFSFPLPSLFFPFPFPPSPLLRHSSHSLLGNKRLDEWVTEVIETKAPHTPAHRP